MRITTVMVVMLSVTSVMLYLVYLDLNLKNTRNSLKIASGIQINIRITQCDLYEVISYHFNRPT